MTILLSAVEQGSITAMTKNRNGVGRRVAPSGAFGYFGSKHRLAKSILEHMPPHHCWVELFGGSLAVTMAKDPAMIEVVNDLDDNIVNAFEQIRDHGDRLIELIEATPYARSELQMARVVQNDDSDIERARKFLVNAMMSINGVMAGKRAGFSMSDTYSRGGREARVNRWCNYPHRLKVVKDRLRRIRIENKDGIKLLDEFSDRPATLVYVDPPYLGDRCEGYKIEALDQSFHERLLRKALLCRCMIVISGYKSETYTTILEGKGRWSRYELTSETQNTNGDRLLRDEMLWMNGPAEQACKTGRVPVELTKKELRDGKVNPPRGARGDAKRRV